MCLSRVLKMHMVKVSSSEVQTGLGALLASDTNDNLSMICRNVIRQTWDMVCAQLDTIYISLVECAYMLSSSVLT